MRNRSLFTGDTKIITFAGNKGGIGKTSCSINFAVEAALHGHEVTLIDLDRQASTARFGDLRSEYTSLDFPRVLSGHATRLKQMLMEAAEAKSTLTIIDTPPGNEDDVSKASEVSDLVIVPTRPVLIEIDAILPTVNIVRRTHTPARVLFTRVPHHSLYLLDEGHESVKHYEIEALPCYIVDRIAFAHAYNNGESVSEYEPRGKAAAEIRALYACITKELKELGGIHE